MMMDDPEFRIEKSQTGDFSAAFSPGKTSSFDDYMGSDKEKLLNEESHGIDDAESALDMGAENNQPKSPMPENVDNGSDLISPILYGDPVSTSTPLSSVRESRVSSVCDADTKRLLMDKSDSETTNSPCVGTPSTTDCISATEEEDKDEDLQSVGMNSTLVVPTLMAPGAVRVPILGFETIEARSKFTVYKINVQFEEDDTGWFIFRRYTDFINLNDQLRSLFPNVRLALPPKRWFRSNFDLEFLEERKEGLQEFLNNATGHRDICNCEPVRDFFCFDDPPGPHDSLEESKAQCECLEEVNYQLKRELTDKDAELSLTIEELQLYKGQVELLTSRLSELNRYLESDKSKFPPGVDIDALFGDGGTILKDKTEDNAGTKS